MKLLCFPNPPPAPLPTFHARCRVYSIQKLVERFLRLRANEETVAADQLKVAFEKLTGATCVEVVFDSRDQAR